MGANLAIFSVVDRLMFRPLPYAEPQRLVQIHDRALSSPNPFASIPQYVARELMLRASSFDGFAYAGVSRETDRIDELGGAEVRLAWASDNLLDLLGVRPVLGYVRVDASGPEPALFLTYATWLDVFGGKPDIVGTTVKADFRYRIAGVLPRGFLLPSSQLVGEIDAVVLEPNRLNEAANPGMVINAPVARLRRGITMEQAQAEADVLYQQITASEAPRMRAPRLFVQPLQQGIFFLYRSPLWLVVGTGGIVLLAAGVNLTTLLLARTRASERTRAIHLALGASVRQLLSTTLLETLLICGAGAALAMIVCAWTQQLLLSVVPPAFRGFATSPIDGRLVLLSLSVTVLVSLAASLAPAWHARRTDVLQTLDRQTGSAVSRLRGGSSLLALQAAFGVVLVAGAVLTVGSYLSLITRSSGWEVDDLFQINVSHDGGADRDQDKRHVLQVIETVESTPGVIAAGAANRRPFDRFGLIQDQWKALGRQGAAWGVSAGLFSAMGMSIRAGRVFTHDEVARKELVAVLNETAVTTLWPGVDDVGAVGRTVRTLDGERLVLGIVGDIQRYPGETPIAAMYLPISADEMRMSQSAVEVLLRVERGHQPDLSLINARLDDRFGRDALPPARRVSDMLAPWFERPRFLAALLGSFALISLILAGLGVFAVSSFDAARRRHEMAVRVTLGATRRHLRQLILRAVVRPVVIGSTLGLLGAWWSVRLVEGLVSGIPLHDARLHIGVAVFFVTVAALAAWLPARRAAHADPSEILRSN
jgi:predicted permease